MGQPDGGWFDETPPKVVGASPSDRATDVNSKKVNIFFDEFSKLENASEKVVVSPPQLEAPEIKAQGKHISVALQDKLQPNTTYTIDFSDAISDNNEGNPLGNYTYSFSTWKQRIWSLSRVYLWVFTAIRVTLLSKNYRCCASQEPIVGDTLWYVVLLKETIASMH